MKETPKPADTEKELLLSFHEQFSLNQNHSQSLFIQFISAVLVVIIGYGLVFSNTDSSAEFIDVTRNVEGDIISYSFVHLSGAYFIAQFVLVLLASLNLNIGYCFRRDQKVIDKIRYHYLGTVFYKQIFGTSSFNAKGKKLIFNSYLPGFNLIFISFIYFLQIILLSSIIFLLVNFKHPFTHNPYYILFTYFLILSPICFSLIYFRHYFKKYRKVIDN